MFIWKNLIKNEHDEQDELSRLSRAIFLSAGWKKFVNHSINLIKPPWNVFRNIDWVENELVYILKDLIKISEGDDSGGASGSELIDNQDLLIFLLNLFTGVGATWEDEEALETSNDEVAALETYHHQSNLYVHVLHDVVVLLMRNVRTQQQLILDHTNAGILFFELLSLNDERLRFDTLCLIENLLTGTEGSRIEQALTKAPHAIGILMSLLDSDFLTKSTAHKLSAEYSPLSSSSSVYVQAQCLTVILQLTRCCRQLHSVFFMQSLPEILIKHVTMHIEAYEATDFSYFDLDVELNDFLQILYNLVIDHIYGQKYFIQSDLIFPLFNIFKLLVVPKFESEEPIKNVLDSSKATTLPIYTRHLKPEVFCSPKSIQLMLNMFENLLSTSDASLRSQFCDVLRKLPYEQIMLRVLTISLFALNCNNSYFINQSQEQLYRTEFAEVFQITINHIKHLSQNINNVKSFQTIFNDFLYNANYSLEFRFELLDFVRFEMFLTRDIDLYERQFLDILEFIIHDKYKDNDSFIFITLIFFLTLTEISQEKSHQLNWKSISAILIQLYEYIFPRYKSETNLDSVVQLPQILFLVFQAVFVSCKYCPELIHQATLGSVMPLDIVYLVDIWKTNQENNLESLIILGCFLSLLLLFANHKHSEVISLLFVEISNKLQVETLRKIIVEFIEVLDRMKFAWSDYKLISAQNTSQILYVYQSAIDFIKEIQTDIQATFTKTILHSKLSLGAANVDENAKQAQQLIEKQEAEIIELKKELGQLKLEIQDFKDKEVNQTLLDVQGSENYIKQNEILRLQTKKLTDDLIKNDEEHCRQVEFYRKQIAVAESQIEGLVQIISQQMSPKSDLTDLLQLLQTLYKEIPQVKTFFDKNGVDLTKNSCFTTKLKSILFNQRSTYNELSLK